MSPEKNGKLQEDDRRKYQGTAMGTGLEALGFVFQLGLTMAVPILSGVLIGEWLDLELGTGRFFFGVMTSIGIAVGFYIAYRQIIPSRKRREKMDRSKTESIQRSKQ